MQFIDLITEFAKKIGISEVTPNEEGIVVLDIDDMIVSLMEIKELNHLITYAKIGEKPPEDNGTLSETLLNANHLFQGTMGATISFNKEDNSYYICRYDNLSLLDAPTFVELLEKFVNTLESWQKILKDYRPINDEKVVENLSVNFNMGNFISV